MKRVVIIVAVCFCMLGLVFGCSDDRSSITGAQGDAEDMAQMSLDDVINQKIVSEAYSYWMGAYTGLSCKQWVQRVVWDAVNYWLPLNSSDPSRWYSSSGTREVLHQTTGISSFSSAIKPGMIVQAHVKYTNGPHTMIVVGVTSSKIYVRECNWPSGYKVGARAISVADWNRMFYSWTIYQIRAASGC